MTLPILPPVIRLNPADQPLNPGLSGRLLAHFQACERRISSCIADVELEFSGLMAAQIPPWSKTVPLSCSRLSFAILRFLADELLREQDRFLAEKAKALSDSLTRLYAASAFVSELIRRPDFVIVPIDRITAPIRVDRARFEAIRRAFDSLLFVVSIVPDPSSARVKAVFREVVSAGVAARKSGFAYFPEMPAEDFLGKFLGSEESPIREFLPYSKGTDPALVREWVMGATGALLLWGGEEMDESAISIIVLRFLFQATYPLLYPRDVFDSEFAKRLAAFSQKTPVEIGIAPKYVPPDLADCPVSELFEVDSIGQAPIAWFRNARHAVCPLDAAFCVVKAHEALSVMAILRGTAGHETAAVRDFYDQMPGFDDIFEIWLAFVAVVREMDPRGLLAFIERYSGLPGFTARINVAVAYLEGALAHLTNGSDRDG
jgi:hypothetical protein